MSDLFVSPELIGRSHEMEILDQALRAAQEGAGQCILIGGEAGIGKSRLTIELSRHASARHFLILRGFCSEQDVSFPYAPWMDALRAFLAPRSAAEVNELLGIYAPEMIKLLPELALLLPSIQPTPPLDPAAEKHRLFETFMRFTASLALGAMKV